MEVKQGKEETEFLKDEHDDTKKFILQKNKKTKTAIAIIIVFLAVLVLAVVFSGVFFGDDM